MNEPNESGGVVPNHKERNQRDAMSKRASERASERKNEMLPSVLFLPTSVPASTWESRGAVAISGIEIIYSSRVRPFTPFLQSAQQYNYRLASRVLFCPRRCNFAFTHTHPETSTTQTHRHKSPVLPCMYLHSRLSVTTSLQDAVIDRDDPPNHA